MALTDLQRKKLIDGINNLPVKTILKYIQTGDISLDDVPHITAERKQYILDQQNSMPNPVEQQEWQAIEMMLIQPSAELVQKLSELLDRGSHHVTLRIPYSDAGIMDLLNREASVKMTEYTDEGIEAEVIVPPEIFGRVKRYIPGYVEPKEDWED